MHGTGVTKSPPCRTAKKGGSQKGRGNEIKLIFAQNAPLVLRLNVRHNRRLSISLHQWQLLTMKSTVWVGWFTWILPLPVPTSSFMKPACMSLLPKQLLTQKCTREGIQCNNIVKATLQILGISKLGGPCPEMLFMAQKSHQSSQGSWGQIHYDSWV